MRRLPRGSVCVCVCERERARERERCGLAFDRISTERKRWIWKEKQTLTITCCSGSAAEIFQNCYFTDILLMKRPLLSVALHLYLSAEMSEMTFEQNAEIQTWIKTTCLSQNFLCSANENMPVLFLSAV